LKLGDVAHVRTGDKGDTSQISVIAFDRKDYPALLRLMTGERLVAHLAQLPVSSVTRHELPHIGALNFVLAGALDGGVTRSLALDAHGKTLGAQLLDMPLGSLDPEVR
jgi:hypothetical protein